MPIHVDPAASGMIAEGPHELTITSVEERTSSSGNPMLVVELENPDGKQITDWITLRKDLIDWKLKPLWEAAGLAWPTSESTLDENQLIDKTLTATVTHQRRDGFVNAKIEAYHPPGETGSDVTNQMDLTDFKPPAEKSDDDDSLPF